MTAKATKPKKSARSEASKPESTKARKPTKSVHVPTPWLKLKQLWESGASYEAMGKATDAHYDETKSDATKATRAKIWKARHVGVTIEGKLVKFGARGKTKEPAKKGKPTKEVKKGQRKKNKTIVKPLAQREAKAEASGNPESPTKETSS